MNALTNNSNQANSSVFQANPQFLQNDSKIQNSAQSSEEMLLQNNWTHLLHGVLEGLMDGILILTEQGKLVDANSAARQLCHQFMQGFSLPSEVPQEIWNICEALIESRNLLPDRPIVIEDEVNIGRSKIRIRARWIEVGEASTSCVLVMLEDRHQSIMNVAIAEARKYGLTAREAEVWLLRRANCTYKAIAAELHIAIDTVKKHIKSINAKRDACMWANE